MNGRYLFLTGSALGAGLMYLLDPISGKRRRAFTRDQMTHLAKETDRLVGQTGRDLRNRYEGVVAEAKRFWTHEEVSDALLAERVRTALGRVVSHPRSLEVAAEHGWITLTGPVLASEERQLLHRIRRVSGVRGVENSLKSTRAPRTFPVCKEEFRGRNDLN
jgi:osmotically-inducible protein OsmY